MEQVTKNLSFQYSWNQKTVMDKLSAKDTEQKSQVIYKMYNILPQSIYNYYTSKTFKKNSCV